MPKWIFSKYIIYQIVRIENIVIPFVLYVKLCKDVLLDVLKNGRRSQLDSLEQIGRKFNWLINSSSFDAEPKILVDDAKLHLG